MNQILLDAAKLVRKGWVQGDFARDAAGESVLPTSRHAVCWCAVGAIAAAGGRTCDRAALRRYIQKPTIAYWNDVSGRTAEEVARAMEAAANVE